MSMREKLHTGELYLPDDEEIMKEQFKKLDRLYDFNQTSAETAGSAPAQSFSRASPSATMWWWGPGAS